MTYQPDTDRNRRAQAPIDGDPALRDPALREPAYTSRSGAGMWIVGGLVVLLGVFAIWGGMFDNDNATRVTENTANPPVVEQTTPPAAQEPVPAPETVPEPAPAPAPAE